MEFTQEDLKNIYSLISAAQIKGSEAEIVASLKEKVKNYTMEEVKVEKVEAE